MHDLTWYAIFGTEPMKLPLSLTLSSVNHTILVDGSPHVFEGVGLNTSAWSGAATLNDGSIVVVSVRGIGVVPEAIARCSETALPDPPPPDR